MTSLTITTGTNLTPSTKARILRTLKGYGYSLSFEAEHGTYLSVFEDGEGEDATPSAIHAFDTVDGILDRVARFA